MRPLMMRLATVAALLLGAGRVSLALDLAVVVHPQKGISEISVADLREIVLMDRQHWKGGGRIYVLLPETGTPEKGVLLKKVLKMTEEQLRRHYLGKLYSGEIGAFPTVARSGAEALRAVSRAPHAIALVNAGVLDASVKALRVQGRRPGDAGYVLASPR
jgi:hypothetical protein